MSFVRTHGFLLLITAATACGGGGGGGGTGATALMCKDVAFCTAFDYKTFVGTLDKPSGGTIADGIYRSAWKVTPSGATHSQAGYSDTVEVLAFSGNTWVRNSISGERGTYTANGSSLTLAKTTGCNLGTEGTVEAYTYSYQYTATPTQLTLFKSVMTGSTTYMDEVVYLKVSNPNDVCTTVSADPMTPGDSPSCKVSNCYCQFAAPGTIDSSTCH